MQDVSNRKVLKMSVKIHLCAFADSRLKKSSDRLLSQARKFGGFDSIRIFDETDLDEAFREEFRDKLRPDVRGFGYWVWKPQIILQTLAAAEQDSIILYLDIGCHLNPGGKHRFGDYIERFQSSEKFVMAGDVSPSHLERTWTKGDLLDYFGVRHDESITNTSQIATTFSFFKKNNSSIDFLQNWLAVFRHDFALADDTPSKTENLPSFIEHRHDQSIFSILSKQAGLEIISVSETYPVTRPKIKLISKWLQMNKYPIQARRDKRFSKQNPATRLAKQMRRYGLLPSSKTDR
jgi:hypothetical protein